MTAGLKSRRLRLEPFTAAHVPAVRAFNRRLAGRGAPWRFPEEPTPSWLPRTEHSSVYQEYFLAVQEDEVRGAYVLKHHGASIGGEMVGVGTIYWPLSEGSIDRAYALVGPELVRDALRREPLLFGVGLEGQATPIARLLQALRWRLAAVPFQFKVLNGTRFLRELRYLRSTRLRRWVLDLAALSGAGRVGAKLADSVLTSAPDRAHDAEAEVVDTFDAWADDLWDECRRQYSFLSTRDHVALNSVFPPGKPGFARVKVARRGRVIGMAVLKDALDPDHPSFGGLRLGTIADCLADPSEADAVIRASTTLLRERGVDMIVSNQTHPGWRSALRRAGFLSGPSTCVLATSPRLTDLISGIDYHWSAVHVNRGDGDYPWGLTLAPRAEAGRSQ